MIKLGLRLADWNAQVGVYTYDQAVVDFGQPAAAAKLNDGSTVADWTRRRSAVVTPGPVVYSASSYAPRGVGYEDPAEG